MDWFNDSKTEAVWSWEWFLTVDMEQHIMSMAQKVNYNIQGLEKIWIDIDEPTVELVIYVFVTS